MIIPALLKLSRTALKFRKRKKKISPFLSLIECGFREFHVVSCRGQENLQKSKMLVQNFFGHFCHYCFGWCNTKALKHSQKVELARGMANFTSLLNSVNIFCLCFQVESLSVPYFLE